MEHQWGRRMDTSQNYISHKYLFAYDKQHGYKLEFALMLALRCWTQDFPYSNCCL